MQSYKINTNMIKKQKVNLTWTSLEESPHSYKLTDEEKYIWFIQFKLINIHNLKQTEVKDFKKSIIQNKTKIHSEN